MVIRELISKIELKIVFCNAKKVLGKAQHIFARDPVWLANMCWALRDRPRSDQLVGRVMAYQGYDR